MNARQNADIAGLDPRSETLENVAAALAVGIMIAVCIVAGLSS